MTQTESTIRCCGALDENDQPMCEGPDVRHVRALAPAATSDEQWFETEWCEECRGIAEADGYRIHLAQPRD